MKLFRVNFDLNKYQIMNRDDSIERKDKEKIYGIIDCPVLVEGDERLRRFSTMFKKYDIGNVEDVTSSYVFQETTAPRQYDGFSTIHIKGNIKYGNAFKPAVRIIATMPCDLDWQRMRYESGGYYSVYWYGD